MNRKKKFISILIVIAMLLAFLPQTALATWYTVSDGQTLNLTSGELTRTSDGTLIKTCTIKNGDVISVVAGATATITGSKDVMIRCDAGVTLTLDSVTSDVSGLQNACALSFTGSGNTLILEGESALSSGERKAGVLVQGNTQLTIEGTGELEARGGTRSAGIGAGTGDCGTLLIRGSVTINARGGRSYGAGIGGADGFSKGGSGGNITIKGGTVKAAGGYCGAGIGGGGVSSSGLNPGGGRGGVINISGGTVVAYGGKNNISGGGIGCGGVLKNDPAAPYTELNITGGNVFAASFENYDIYVYKDAEFNISNDAAVFLRYDSSLCSAANITSHTRYKSKAADEDGYLFGIELPGWPSAAAAFIVPKTVSYDLNGVDGTPMSDAIIHSTGVVKIPTQEMTGYNDQELVNWNTQADGLGVGYTPGMFTEVADDTTLYAVWGAYAVSGVTLAQDSLILSPGSVAALEANVSPGGAANASLSWTSSDENVATVDSRGVVTAVGTGSALITAESLNGLSDTCQVAVSSVLINYSLSTGSAMEMTTAVDPDATAVWTSDDETVATVDSSGKVTSVSIDSSAKTLSRNQTASLSATVLPSDATNANVTWTSSDTDIATVDANGKVIAKNFGFATITAEADGITAVCTVSVVKRGVTGVTLSSTSETLKKGATTTLSATVSPSDATNANVTWKSTNTSVARVDQSGKVTALADGSAAITVEADGKFAVCVVLVSSDEDIDNDATQTEKVTPTATPLEAEPASSPTPVATAGDSGMTITPDIVKRDEQTGKITIEFHINELPEGTSSIKLPGGEIIHVADSENGMISITVDENELDAAGDLQIIFLDDQEVPFGSASVEVSKNEGTEKYPSWLLWTIGVIGVSLIAASAVLHLGLKKRRNQKGVRR